MLTPIYIYFTSPHGLYVTSPNIILVLSSMHYVMQTPLLYALHHTNVIEMNSLHYPPPKIASSQYQHMFLRVVK